MGIYTVSITRLGLDNVMEYLEGNNNWRIMRKIGSDVELIKARIPMGLTGTMYSSLHVPGKMRPVAVERQGRSMIPDDDMCCEYNDVLLLTVSSDYLTQARDMLQL